MTLLYHQHILENAKLTARKAKEDTTKYDGMTGNNESANELPFFLINNYWKPRNER